MGKSDYLLRQQRHIESTLIYLSPLFGYLFNNTWQAIEYNPIVLKIVRDSTVHHQISICHQVVRKLFFQLNFSSKRRQLIILTSTEFKVIVQKVLWETFLITGREISEAE